MNRPRLFRSAALAALLLAVLVGCAARSPEEKVASLRSLYTARAIGFVVDAAPEAEPAEDQEAPPAEDPAAAPPAEGEGEEAEPAETVPTRQNVRLDILLQHDSPEKLPGITLDISMIDAVQTEKGHWRLWVDTADLPKATGSQFTYLLEDVDFVEGDGFGVEVRHPIPPEERGEYKEFAVSGG